MDFKRERNSLRLRGLREKNLKLPNLERASKHEMFSVAV